MILFDFDSSKKKIVCIFSFQDQKFLEPEE